METKMIRRYLAACAATFTVTLLLLLSALNAQAQTAVTVAVDLDPASTSGITPEGLVSDSSGRLYIADTSSHRLWRYTPSSSNLDVLGTLPRATTGMAFDKDGNLYLASGDRVLKILAANLSAASVTTDTVQTYAMGTTGANGLAFNGAGDLFVSGGASGNIYMIATSGVTNTWASGFKSDRADQAISTNGLAFGTDGMLYSSNTGTGAIDRIAINADGSAGTVTRWVTDAKLLGADGITFASNGDLYVAANEQNAIVRVTPDGTVSYVAQNDNNGPLEFPASPAFSGNALYASNFDIGRGANNPNTPGAGGSIARIDVGVSGLPLPVSSVPGAASPVASPAVVTPVGTTTVTIAPPTVTTPIVEATVTSPSLPAATAVPVEATATALPVPTSVVPGMPTTGAGDVGLSVALALGAAVLLLVIGLSVLTARKKNV
jgi:sugar lactone lactonase YvrE